MTTAIDQNTDTVGALLVESFGERAPRVAATMSWHADLIRRSLARRAAEEVFEVQTS